ncbi:unnamed protein product [Chironomus riparius]|uniref:PHD and RING finger domain-containing protein 1 n=1 Tax=Chironomus riparius TaxID=315576 RepID=A0A9N9WS22_9DIPT|nr:unnamed protein product [Chironomus riparius]
MDEEKNISDQDKIPEELPGTSQPDYDSDGASSSSSANSDNAEKCPICLLSFGSQEIAKPAVCQHAFCFLCIHEWSKVVKTCPIDRKEFKEIIVFENFDSSVPLRTVGIGEQVSLKEFTNGENEYTQCEICRSAEREDVMLLCDGCDKGFHMDCLNPPLLEIPEDNWYCINCDGTDSESESEEESEEQEADIDEINDLQNEIEIEMGQLPSTRLRNRQQPQIIRTLQSERIRNAILARRTLRSAVIDNNLQPSTSQGLNRRSSVQAIPAKKPVKRRKTTRRRRRVTKVVEYELRDGQKFPVKTTRTVRRKKRKSRKTKKARKSSGRRVCSKATSASSFKNSNSNVYDLQKGRQLAGLSNFNIFEPTNLLDYVPDDDGIDEYEAIQNSSGSTLTQSVVNYTNPLRRQALIKKRVINNFTTTSSSVNILDSILNEVSPFDAAISSNKLTKQAGNDKARKSTNDHHEASAQNSNNEPKDQHNEQQAMNSNSSANLDAQNTDNPTSSNNNDRQENTNFAEIHENIVSNERKSPQKKKKQTFDMFGDSPVNQEEDMPNNAEICPNFSIYGSVNRSSDENLSQSQDLMNEENVDLVQMSDGEHNPLDDIEPPAVIRSQPASPDLENDVNDVNDQIIIEERSYTPPILTKDNDKVAEENEKRKRDKEHKRHKRRELERYNVRERFKEKSPKRNRDRFGRNRTRSRTRSRERLARKHSKSNSRDRDRIKDRHKKSKTPEKRRKRSYSRSLSKRDSSNERKQKLHKSKHKKFRRTRSRSLTPQQNRYRDKSPRRRERSTSDKSKKKKRPNRSKEERSTHTKEVFTSGQNILVSVNFNNNNNQEEKRSRSTHSKSHEKYNEEPIVDITAKKKINVSSKPVAIIDLARSPFRELTPDYKKESNVIELSDSEGEKQAPKSPDSTKLYDPFDILNSPSNENVSSSQATTTTSTLKALSKNSIDFTNKLGPAIIKSLNLPLITNNEENLVSSSSSVNNIFDKVFAAPALNKVEVLQNDVIQIPPNMAIESPYSPGNDYDDQPEDNSMEVTDETKANDKQSENIFNDLFGSSTPPFLEKAKSSKKSSSDPDKYLNKLKRQERVVEEVKLVIKPYYANRKITKEQYKEIMRKAVPKICHNKSGEINPAKIKHLIDGYVKMYTHKNKKREVEEIF